MISGRVGLWTSQLHRFPMPAVLETVVALEELGYRTLWIPETAGREPFSTASVFLSATQHLVVATGVARIHGRTASTMQAGWKTIDEAFPGRFVLGIGVSHRPIVQDLHAAAYDKPYSTMVQYLDAMDVDTYTSPASESAPVRVLAALGPRMLRLAADRSHGALTYFVPPEHTAVARATLGDGPALACEQMVTLERDPAAARAIARAAMRPYLQLPNYVNNLRRLGWTDRDLDDGASDRLVDAIVAWGSIDATLARIEAHLQAGASHVCVNVLPSDPRALPLAAWRELSGAISTLLQRAEPRTRMDSRDDTR